LNQTVDINIIKTNIFKVFDIANSSKLMVYKIHKFTLILSDVLEDRTVHSWSSYFIANTTFH
jgi:hypothetical protein